MQNRFQGTQNFIVAHWMAFGAAAVVTLLAVFTIGVSLSLQWWGLLLVSFAAVLILGYGWGVVIWTIYQRYDNPELQPADTLFNLGYLEPDDRIVHIELGERMQALRIARHLTTGHITVVDIYSPQMMPDRALAAMRRSAPPARPDPRLSWQVGDVDLLPLPDASVFAVTVIDTLNHFWQDGDRQKLLAEIYRVLRPGGRLLLAEETRTRSTWLLHGWGTPALLTVNDWRATLAEIGLTVTAEQELQGLMICFRADKLTAGVSRQLPFDWNT